MTDRRHPIQPLEDVEGVLRFKENAIVRRLLDDGPFDMNQIATWRVSRDDAVQFVQLIGYSLSGFGELSYVDDETFETAQRMATEGKSELQARVECLQRLVSFVRENIKDGVAELFGIHPDNLSPEDQ
jgi:hypothetical protein